MLAATRRASSRVSQLWPSRDGFPPTSRLIVLPITGHLRDLPVLAAGTPSLIEWRKDCRVCSWLCGTLSRRRLSCYRHAAMLPCQAKTCRRLDRTRATTTSLPITSKTPSKIAQPTTHSQYRLFVG